MSAIFVFTTTATLHYLFIMSALLIIFTVHTPYNKRIYNTIDGIMLANNNMAVITLLKWYIIINVTGDVVELLTIIMMLLMYIPIIAYLAVKEHKLDFC